MVWNLSDRKELFTNLDISNQVQSTSIEMKFVLKLGDTITNWIYSMVTSLILSSTGDFPRAWALLLEHIEASSLSQSSEVSLAALKSFQEILQIQPAKMPKSLKSSNQVATGLANDLPIPGDEHIKRNNHKDSVQDHKKQVNGATATPSSTSNKDTFDDTAMWAIAWRVWHSIGITSTTPPSSRTANSLPTQPFLTALVQIFPPLFDHIKPRFIAADLQKLCTVLQCAVSVPVQADVSVFIIPSLSDSDLTPLQEAVLHCLYVVQQVRYCVLLFVFNKPW